MWVESLTLENIKSFRDKTTVDFVCGHNAIIGRNGSGKSNLLYALAFVLQPSIITQKETPHVIHHKQKSAYVEISINNEDQQLAAGDKHVKIRRCLGMKSDEFYVNGIRTSMKEVVELIGTSGISTQNPYNVVRQGEINNIATSSSKRRLQVLHDVAGVTVYEHNKTEMQTKLATCAIQISDICENISKNDAELEEIQKQEEALKNYKDIEMKHKALSLVILQKEQEELKKAIKSLEKEMGQKSEEGQKQQEILVKIKSDLKQKDTETENIAKEEKLLIHSKDEIQKQMNSITSKLGKTSLEIKEKKSQIKELEKQVKKQDESRKNEDDQYSKKKCSFESIDKKHQEKQEEISRLRGDIEQREDRLKNLYSRYNRKNKFKTPKDRNEWFAKELDSRKRSIDKQKKMVDSLNTDLGTLMREIKQVQDSLADSNRLLQQLEEEKNAELKQKDNYEKKSVENELIKKGKFQERTFIQHQFNLARDTLKDAENELFRRAGFEMRQKIIGAKSIEKVIQHMKDQQIEADVRQKTFGIFADFFSCDPALNTAVSSIAGSRLFNTVVADADTATKLLRWMKNLGLPGQVDFMPLNKLRPYQNDRPVPANSFRFTEKLVFNEEYRNVVSYVFGSYVLAKSNTQFREIMQCKFDGITLEGDKSSRKGVMTGGYYGDGSTNKYAMLRTVEEKRKRFVRAQNNLQEIEKTANELETAHQKILEQLQQCQFKLDHKLQKTIDSVTVENSTKNETIRFKEKALQDLKNKIALEKSVMDRDIHAFDDLEKERDSGSQSQDSQQAEILMVEIEDAKKEFKKVSENGRKLERERNEQKIILEMLQKEIHDGNAHRQRTIGEIQRLTEQVQILKDTEKTLSDALQKSSDDSQDFQQKIEKVIASKQDVSKELAELIKSKEVVNTQLMHIEGAIDASRLALEKKNCTRDNIEAQISGLGQISQHHLREISNMGLEECVKKKKKLKTQLDKLFGKVNLAALEQLEQLLKEKGVFQNKYKEIEKDHKALKVLLEDLALVKGEKLEATYHQVGKYFEETFSKLVSGGKGTIRLQFENVPIGLSGDGNLTEQRYTGIEIQVNFSGKEAFQEMNSLSGGQKTIVSLALIFAIQKCFEAPIYILDEVDANLDAKRRQSVADYIQSIQMSPKHRNLTRKSVQFISTTFRQELLSSADRVIGVRFRNGVSHANAVSVQEATEFITHQVDDEQSQSSTSSSPRSN